MSQILDEMREKARKQGYKEGYSQIFEQEYKKAYEEAYKEAYEEARQQTRIENIHSLMENLHMTAEQALDVIQASEKERTLYFRDGADI